MVTKQRRTLATVEKQVNVGDKVELDSVDFSDPNRHKTCIEVDFPILPINQVAAIEGNVGKPIYRISKWWARRRSSVFRSILLASVIKSPSNEEDAAKVIWKSYYKNHQNNKAFAGKKVIDIFMGGGCTIVEGLRLGLEMYGHDLNPVAWFIVKQELQKVDEEEVNRLLEEIEREVKPQLAPFYCCDGPDGKVGIWRNNTTMEEMDEKFDPLTLSADERKNYSYSGPEQVYAFWAKHAPCPAVGCGHYTPILKTPLVAEKKLTVGYYINKCIYCSRTFDVEEKQCRMAPDVPLVIGEPEEKFVVIKDNNFRITCPHCYKTQLINFGKRLQKSVTLRLFLHPQWIKGLARQRLDDELEKELKNIAKTTQKSIPWITDRATTIRLVEVRGKLPDKVKCPETGVEFYTGVRGGTVPKKSTFICQADGRMNDVLQSVKSSNTSGPFAGYIVQGFSEELKRNKTPYRGRFFLPFGEKLAKQYNAACLEWENRKDSDLKGYWPKSELPYGLMTHHKNGGLPSHGITHWHKFFNPRQLLSISLILKSICEVDSYSKETREFVLAAFQNFVRNQSLMSIWDIKLDTMSPALANSNFHPKHNVIEVGTFAPMGRGPWPSTTKVLGKAIEWYRNPWELVSKMNLDSEVLETIQDTAKSVKVFPGDSLQNVDSLKKVKLRNSTATNLKDYEDSSIDLVVTDPPFGGLLHYSELSDFFYVWMKLALSKSYPNSFNGEFSPKALEVVANEAREPEDSNGFYRRLLTASWKESYRVLKQGGMLVFTFHHSEDAPWIDVLESLFSAGFYLVSTYPIRSDETKGTGQFGSKTIEYDIIHVCRKRIEAPQRVSWAKLRKKILSDVSRLTTLLELHEKSGVTSADLEVVKRGKALEYYSRHYGQVFIDWENRLSVREALIGINQIITEDSSRLVNAPPPEAEPVTRLFLRIFDNREFVTRDEIHKHLRGTGITIDEFKNRGWCIEEKKKVLMKCPRLFAMEWHRRHRSKLHVDLDQALVIIGSCFEGSGINVSNTIKNANFKPHPALENLLSWFERRGSSDLIITAAKRGQKILQSWTRANKVQYEQLSLYNVE